MLDRIALDRVFRAAKDRGLSYCELYAETCHRVSAQWKDRLGSVSYQTSGGIALTASDGTALHRFVTPSPSTDALLKLLADGFPEGASGPSAPLDPAVSRRISEPLPLMGQVARMTFSDERLRQPSLRLEAELRVFESAREDGEIRRGEEESASLSARWLVNRDGSAQAVNAERSLGSVARLASLMRAGNPFAREIEESLDRRPRWPAPRGVMPVLWSARAVAKLIFPFARALEGDQVISGRSWLTRAALPAALQFQLEDCPPTPFDHEGSPTGKLLLFGEGKPRSIALNRQLADELSSPVTGHCRRSSLDASATVGLWNARVVPAQTVADLDRKVEWGLRVDDLDILDFDPANAMATIRLQRVHLIHHGATGEVVEPVDLRAGLLDVLGALRWFSAAEECLGARFHKQNQMLLMEVTTPAAASDTLSIPGAVPPSHYW